MFHEKILLDARHISDSLISRGVRVVPKNAELNNAVSNMLYGVTHSNASDSATFTDRQVAFERSLCFGEHSHDPGTAQIVDHYVQVLKINLDLTRQYALPMISRISNNLEMKLKEHDVSNSNIMGVSIIPSNVDAPFFSHLGELTELVEQFKESTFNTVPPRPKFIDTKYDTMNIIELMQTGISSLDKAITEYYLNYVPEKTAVWFEDIFCTNTVGSQFSIDLDNMSGGKFLYYLLGFLVSSNISRTEVPDGVTVGLDEYIQAVATYKVYCGRMLYNEFKRVERFKATGYIKHNEFMSGERKIIEVDSEIIDELTQSAEHPNISIETFIGCALSQTATWFKSDFLKNVDKYNDIYNRLQISRIEEIKATRELAARDILATEAVKAFVTGKSVKMEKEQGVSITVNYEDSRQEHLMRFISELIRDSNRSLLGEGDIVTQTCLVLARRLVCEFIFAGTMVKELVERMMQITEADPTINTDHAGLLSVISVITDSLMSQVQFEMDFTQRASLDRNTGFLVV